MKKSLINIWQFEKKLAIQEKKIDSELKYNKKYLKTEKWFNTK